LALRERHSNRPDHAGELRQQATGPVGDRQGDRQRVSGPGRGANPRAAHTHSMQPPYQRTLQQVHPLQRICRLLLVRPTLRRYRRSCGRTGGTVRPHSEFVRKRAAPVGGPRREPPARRMDPAAWIWIRAPSSGSGRGGLCQGLRAPWPLLADMIAGCFRTRSFWPTPPGPRPVRRPAVNGLKHRTADSPACAPSRPCSRVPAGLALLGRTAVVSEQGGRST